MSGPPQILIPDGTTFGRWIVLREAEKSRFGMRRFLCRCECGTERPVVFGALRSGQSRSCGCHRKGIPRRYRVQEPGALFAEVLRELLAKHQVSATELAHRINRTPHHVTNLLCRLSNPVPSMIDSLAEGLAATEREIYRLHLAAARDRGYRI